MNTETGLQIFKKYRVIAVIRASQMQLGLKLAKAVAKGGIKLIEITWDSENPEQIIEQLRSDLRECFIGTGTLLRLRDLTEAIACGSQFAFSPHTNSQLIKTAIAADLPIIPGALTPTEIVTAWQMGATAVKIFPIQVVGGVNYIQSLQGPLGNIPLIPTGGVTLDNAKSFIEAGAIAVGLSSQLFPSHLIESQNWEAITALSEQLINNISEPSTNSKSDE